MAEDTQTEYDRGLVKASTLGSMFSTTANAGRRRGKIMRTA
ncbi:hypothetical protein HCEG_01671 [Histoplasma capsulatum var. duboisii H88]|uniref:Uncharacterized protein n=1 Tax=Ajellomyces capsulatus (strain H88) TaxID=544711 RepID=F0U6I1_AJEC8|nr:hypothetical protein HCEG_01671 [Histoplasma capsulatum var. duboisii H88]